MSQEANKENVVVMGNSVSEGDSIGNTLFDYYTAKYASADGALIWEKQLTGPTYVVGGSSRCLALRRDGMVAGTGTGTFNVETPWIGDTTNQALVVRQTAWTGDTTNQALIA